MKNWLSNTIEEFGNEYDPSLMPKIQPDQLNRKQRFAFNLVHHHHTLNQQLLMIVLGEGGTGKSFTINAISTLLGESLKRAAPTAKAAFLILGDTCHRTFKIKPHKEFAPLTGCELGFLEEEFRQVTYLIIDEFSMLSQEMLGMINLRLQQVKKSQKPFGGLSVILTGDLGQLLPVGGQALYSKSGNNLLTVDGFQSYYRFSVVVKLDQLVRQQQDGNVLQEKFIDLLPRLRNGTSTYDDYQLLMSRQVNLHNVTSEFADAVRLYQTNSQVDEENIKRLSSLRSPIVRIKAINSNARSEQASSDNFGGLENNLLLAIGAQIVWLHNTWTAKGLTNGSPGEVKDIVFDRLEEPPSIIIHFPNYIGPQFFVENERRNWIPVSMQSIFSKPLNGHRNQFPMRLAYALTIHKCQGQTVPKCILDIGANELSIGQTYVAFSR